MDNRAHAHRYLDSGWHPFPLPEQEKHPPPEGLTGYGGVDLTPAEVDARRWDGNIGVRVPVDVVGIDVDAYKGGDVTLANLVGTLCPLPLTFLSHSSRHDGSGILFFRVPVGLHWVPGLPGVEVIQRGHRYAVVWPSIHPEHRPYYWLDQREPDVPQGVPLVEDLAELPWAWIEELSRASDDEHDVTKAVDLAGRTDFLAAHVAAEAPGYFTSKVVGRFSERTAQGFSRHDTMQHCLTWAMECVRAGISSGEAAVAELGAVWSRALAGEPERAALTGVRPTEFEAMLRHAIGKAQSNPQSKIDKLHDDVIGLSVISVPGAQAPAEVIDVYQPPAPSSTWLNWHDFVNRDASTDTWLVEGLWPWGRAIALWADAKVGKSELALWCACKLALGEHPWTNDPVEPVDVAYFDYEMTADDLDDRLNDFDIDPLRLDRLHYMQLPMLHPLDVEAGGAEVEALVRECGAKATVIDTLGRAVAGEENAADTVDAFYRHTGSRLKQMGVGYLRTDHSGKDSTRGPRGTSAKVGDVDVSWHQERTNDGVLLDCTGATRIGWVKPKLALDRVILNDVVRYTTPVVLGVPGGTLAKAQEFDALGVPLDIGRPAAIAALRAAGLKPGRNEVLTAALKHRRETAQRARRASGTAPGTVRKP